MKKVIRNEKGLTLVEFIVIAFILVTIAGIVTGVIVSVLRGSSSTQRSLEVTGNGNFAISVITQLISSSTGITAVGEEEIADCTEQPTAHAITVKGFDGGITSLSCENETIASNGASLVNNISLRVPQNTCSFTCTQASPYDKPLIQIEFEIESRTYDFPEDMDKKNFQTSVTLRNFQP